MARSAQTEAAYQADRDRFAEWCDAQGYALVEGVALDPAVVGAWLADQFNEGGAPSTVRRRAAAIAAWHKDRGFASPTADPVVQRVLGDIDEAVRQAPRNTSRRRQHRGQRRQLSVRANDAERARWEKAAKDSGLSLSAWIGLTCEAAVDRVAAPSDLVELRQALSELGDAKLEVNRVGTNLNQVAYRYNAGDPVSVEVMQAAADAVTAAVTSLQEVAAEIQGSLHGRRRQR